MRYWKALLIALALALGPYAPAFAAGTPVKLYKNPNCGCCNAYAEYLSANGFDVQAINTTDMSAVKKKFAVPEKLEGCHTAVIDGYVFEGLIPVQYLRQVLSERRPIRGLSLPGMPAGVPGMPGTRHGPLHIYYLSSAPAPEVFATF